MKILVINHYSGSRHLGMAYRSFYLGREWVRSGHQVTLVAASYSHVRTIQPRVFRNLDTTEEEGVRYRWVCTNSYNGNGAGRVTNILSFVGNLLASARQIAREERPDIVICSSTYPLDIYPGEWIAKRADARLIFEVRDLWPLTPILLGGYSARHPFIRLLQRAEDKAYCDSDLVVSVLPAAKDYMVSRGMHGAKFVHIPNGVALDDDKCATDFRVDNIISHIQKKKILGRFVVCYAGNIGVAQNLSTLVDAASLLTDTNVTFFLLGNGAEIRLLKEKSLAQGIKDMHFFSRIAKCNINRVLQEMDVLYFGLRSSTLYEFGISPNKLFDYMLAGRPILQAVASENNLVSEAHCGLTVSPDDPRAVAEAILKLHDMSPEERTKLGENGRRYVSQNHDYRILARHFIERIIDSCGVSSEH